MNGRRSKHVSLFDSEYPLIAVEDAIVSKLQWNAQIGGSERQIADIRGMIQRQGENVDWSYVEEVVKELNLVSHLEEIRRTMGSEPE